MTLRLSSHVGPIFSGELSVSCVPVTLGTPFIGAAHLVRKWRVCSNTSGFPAKLCHPPLPFRATHISFCPSLWSASSVCLVCIQRSLSWKSAWEKEQKWRTRHLTKQGRGERTKEERKRGGREGKNNHEGSGLPVESRILRKKGRLQSDFPAKDRAGFFPPIFSMWALDGALHKETSSYLPPFSAFPSTRSGRHINHSGCPSVFLSCGLLPMVSKAAERQMPDTWLFGSWAERGVASLCSDFNVPWIKFALRERDTLRENGAKSIPFGFLVELI